MSPSRRVCLVLFGLLALSGCGRKGPLFLPEQKVREHLPPSVQPSTPAPAPTQPSTPPPPPVSAP